jgi:hypothetical protein
VDKAAQPTPVHCGIRGQLLFRSRNKLSVLYLDSLLGRAGSRCSGSEMEVETSIKNITVHGSTMQCQPRVVQYNPWPVLEILADRNQEAEALT